MRNLIVLVIHLIATLARLLGPGGVRSLVAESLLLKHQLLIVNRSRQRSPNLSGWDRILAGLLSLLVRPARLPRSAIVLKPSTLLGLHKAMSERKYQMLFSANRRRKPGPKGPNNQLIDAVVEMKQRNPRWGCPRIAQQIALAFNIQIDKDMVRRILANHHRSGQDSGGPSWLTFLGHMKDSLWSIDLFRCDSATLRTHWVLVVMDQYTRRIIGFGVHAGKVDGVALCRMFNRAIRGHRWLPKYLSSDNDPLYRFHQWQANLRILEVTEIKSIPYVPLSHPFVERLIGTLHREYLDHLLFWTTADLENKLLDFRTYFNNHRTHSSREGRTPVTPVSRPIANLRSFRWQPHCRSLYQTPMAA
jgi:putative transposase